MALLCNSAADAAWHEARSTHFIIYSDTNPRELKEFATRLERFDQGVRAAITAEDPPVGDGNRLTVFVMPKAKDIQQLVGDKSGFLGGFYTGRATGSLAYIAKASNAIDPDAIFFHEYTHHLMMQQLDQPYPEWYVEGFAEFFSTPAFEKDGSMWFGAPVQSRAWGLFNGKQLPLATLLAGTYGEMSKLPPEQRESIYGRGWLLAHYLLMETARHGQLKTYINAMAAGRTQADAAGIAFGDLKILEQELDRYRSKSLLRFKIGANKIRVGDIAVTPMTEGAARIVLTRGKLKYGAKRSTAEQLLPEIQTVAARYPGDEMVELTLAEAELLARHAAAAESAADRALKANPRSTEALVLKARSIAERALDEDEPKRHASFEQARATLIAANKLDSEDPEPLFEYYRSFAYEGRRPTDNAIAAMHYASDLAPQDFGLRMTSAVAYLNDNKLKEARTAIAVVAYSPHGGGLAETARKIIAKIDAGDGKGALQAAFSGPSSRTAEN